MNRVLTVAVEGASDQAVIRRLCTMANVAIAAIHVANGKPRLDARLGAYNRAAQFSPWLVLRDFDNDAPCVSALHNKLLTNRATNMHLRFPMRAMEAWLLADRKGISHYLSISATRVPANPESLVRPKRTLVDLARHSRSRAVKDDFLPVKGHTVEVGPGYTARIQDFAANHWHPLKAAENCSSLSRCIRIIEAIAKG